MSLPLVFYEVPKELAYCFDESKDAALATWAWRAADACDIPYCDHVEEIRHYGKNVCRECYTCLHLLDEMEGLLGWGLYWSGPDEDADALHNWKQYVTEPYHIDQNDEHSALCSFHDFNRELQPPSANYPEGAVIVLVDDDFWIVAVLPWRFRTLNIKQIVNILWPDITRAHFSIDSPNT